MNNSDDKIPGQHTGAQSDIIEEWTLPTDMDATSIYNTAKQRLLDINNWNTISEGISADFILTDPQGVISQRAPEKDDYIRIDIPGPGSSAGDGYDWVQIETIEESKSSSGTISFLLRVRPAADPRKKEGTAHFFTQSATSSFMVRRSGTTVSAEVHGRNEEANTGNDKLTDKIRNMIIGTGAKAGLSIIQWKKLVKGILNKTDE